MKRNISLSLVLVFLFSACAQAQQMPIKIAIVADKAAGLNKSPLVSLLEVQLSQKQGIELLERAAIEKILQEQQLSAAGLLERNNTIKTGKLLRADAFVILSLENQTKDSGNLIRVRVAETAHGLRLSDRFEELDGKKLEETTERIVKDINVIVGKLNLPAGQAIPIGIVDIHRVQLGERHKLLERALPVLLSVRLSKEPKIIMLEREDLKVLLDEKLLTEGKDSEFWSSAILIDGYLQPKDGSLEMTLRLRQAGKEIATVNVSVEPNEPSLAIEKAANEIIKQIQDSPPSTQWQPELEAQEFYKQGQLLSNHLRYEEAITPFETAHALQPQNVFYTGSLFVNEWNLRCEIENKSKRGNRRDDVSSGTESPGYSDLELAELVSLLVRQIQDGYDKGQLSTRDIYYKWSISLGFDLRRRSYFAYPVSVATEQIRQINRENRKIWIEMFEVALQQQPIRDDYPKMNDLVRARMAWISSEEPDELMANLRKAFTEFVMPPEMGGKIESAKDREHFFHQILEAELHIPSVRFLDNTYLKGSGEEFLELWWEFLNELTDVNDPIVSWSSKQALIQGGWRAGGKERFIESERLGLRTLNDLINEIKDTDKPHDNDTKRLLINNVKSLLKGTRSIGFNDTIGNWEDICEHLIQQKDINSLVLLDLGWRPFNVSDPRLLPEVIKRYYILMGRVAEVLQTQSGDKQVRSALINIRDFQVEIRKRFPDLDIFPIVPSLPVTMLLRKDDWQHIDIIFPDSLPSRAERWLQFELQDKMLWTAFANVGLANINLQESKLKALWWADIPRTLSTFPRLTGIVIGETVSYVSIQNTGIVELPGSLIEGRELFVDSNIFSRSSLRLEILERLENQVKNGQKTFKKPKVYTKKNGLPSLLITSIAIQADKLWIAYGDRGQESGLGVYDPKTGQWETVFCSSLMDNLPFSAGQPYQINSLTCINPDKLLFNVSGIDQSGLWRMDVETRDLKFISPINGEIFKDLENKYWIRSIAYLIKFEPNSEKMKLFIRDSLDWMKRYPQRRLPLNMMEEDIFVPESFLENVTLNPYYAEGNLDLSTGAIHNNKLWARLGKSQILIIEKDKSFEDAQIIDNDILDGEPVERFVSTPYGLVAIGNGTVGLIETESNSK